MHPNLQKYYFLLTMLDWERVLSIRVCVEADVKHWFFLVGICKVGDALFIAIDKTCICKYIYSLGILFYPFLLKTLYNAILCRLVLGVLVSHGITVDNIRVTSLVNFLLTATTSLTGAVDHGGVKADQVWTFVIFLDPNSSILRSFIHNLWIWKFSNILYFLKICILAKMYIILICNSILVHIKIILTISSTFLF